MFKQISEYNAVPGLGKIPLMERRFPKVNRRVGYRTGKTGNFLNR